VDISVYDLSGKRIYSSKRNVAPESLDIGTKDGVYLVRLHALP
jgi:hypothetical protein